MSSSDSSPRLLAPRYWLSWIGIGVLWLIAKLPYRALYALGRAFGLLTRWLPGERRHVARRNLEICLPQLDTQQRERLLRSNLADLGLMLVEFASAWMGSQRASARIPCTIEGADHMLDCRKKGKGILLIAAHFSHLELCGRLVSVRCLREAYADIPTNSPPAPISAMYRVMDDPVFDYCVMRARRRYYADTVFSKDALRATVKHLKHGGLVWYAPDQDMRGKDTTFVPFFGVSASTITATHHLARLSGAAVIPFFQRRLPDGRGYALRLEAPLEDFPSGDVNADTARVNAVIERMVREAPDQYLWIHKRFKSRPPGEPPLY